MRDRDSTMLTGASVAITSPVAGESLGFTPQHGITGTPGGDTLTLSGTATLAQYEDVLRSVTYDNSSQNPPNVTRILSFVVTDAGGLPSEPSFQGVDLTPVNDAPVVTTSAGSTPYTENAAATAIDDGLTVTDADDTALEGATVTIATGLQAGDELLFTDQNGITGDDTVPGVLTLTGTASVADYQTALRSVEFSSTNDDPVSTKTVEFIVDDGDDESAAATKDLTITPVDDGPEAVDDSATVNEDAAAAAIDVLANDTDVDGGPMTIQATVRTRRTARWRSRAAVPA